jgi:phage FluMu protein gp41
MNQTGTLKDGLVFKQQPQFDFEMRPIQTTGELFDAEIEAAGVENQLAFNGALMARQLVRVGDCNGPFSLAQIRALSPRDWQILRAAQAKLNAVDDDPND